MPQFPCLLSEGDEVTDYGGMVTGTPGVSSFSLNILSLSHPGSGL